MNFICRFSIAVLWMSALAWATCAQGPDWKEEGDAGSGAGTAQQTNGVGQLQGISGMLGGIGPADDFEDMFVIRIVDPTRFRVSTSIEFGGGGEFDTQLWLFEEIPSLGGGPLIRGLLANDDEPGNNFGQSTITQFANDGTNAGVFEPGIYYLAISAFNNDPTADGGEIFFQKSRDEISGPDGPGGGGAHFGWTRGESSGTNGLYQIRLEGVGFSIPAPGALPLLAVAGVLAHRRRRRH